MRSILIVLDSLGIGAAPDADRYGDWGADTLGHLFAHTPELALPALFSLGLGEVLAGSRRGHGIRAGHGRIRTISPGKDSTSAHWEMMGVIPKLPFTVYEKLPPQLVEAMEVEAKVTFLGRDAEEPRKLWREHAATGNPMLALPKGESVIEISAHEGAMPRARLYEIGRVVRRLANAHRIARIVAQPLAGKPGAYLEAKGRHEYPMVPPRTVLNAIAEAGLVVEGVGKAPELFGRSGITHAHSTRGNAETLAAVERLWEHAQDGLIFANVGDFDPLGHARDVAGFAKALMDFDQWLGGFLARVTPEDLLIITADHGNDPVFRDRDHTREELPLLAHYDGLSGPLGTRETLADIGATLAQFFQLKEAWPPGASFIDFKTPKPRKVRLKMG
ncbi:MAG TPA: phosphopentomutase [Chthoniobacteraceae bacterium]|jgi:phosphopentomutase|nr:phosphopentomutase [Chthoniobacteraceae bacterium]